MSSKNSLPVDQTNSRLSQTMSVPEAGQEYYGLSRNGSYEAAAVGLIPTIRIGKLLRVPRRAMERILDQAADRATKNVA
jgi:hypothetical protein